MKNRTSRFPLLLTAILAVLQSCTPTVPSDYIQPDKMEGILYDYHLAEAMYRETSGTPSTMIAYKTAVLKKHHVTEAEFDSAMVYYTRHPKYLQSIYESLANRMSNEALAQGASASEINRYSLNSVDGDTTNVWQGERTLIFTPHRPFNVSSFSVQADTTFHRGDQLWLNFNTQFIYQDGIKDAMAVLAITLSNDSVVTRALHISTPNHYTLRVTDSRRLGIKKIRGFFLLNSPKAPSEAYSTTFKLMIISNISLVRIHEKKTENAIKTDSVSRHSNTIGAKDTVLQTRTQVSGNRKEDDINAAAVKNAIR